MLSCYAFRHLAQVFRMLREDREGNENYAGRNGKTDKRSGTTRTRLGAPRGHVAQHDFYGRHWAIRGDSVRDSGDAWAAESGGVDCGSVAGGARWLHLGGAWRGDAAGRRKLHLPAGGVWAGALGTADFVSVYLADDFSRATEHRVGRARVC